MVPRVVRCTVCRRRKTCRDTIARRPVCRPCYKNHIAPVAACPTCTRVMHLTGYIDHVRVCATCDDRHRRTTPNGHCCECGKLDYLVRGRCGAHYKALQVASRRVGSCTDCRERKTVDSRGRCSIHAARRSREARLRGHLVALLGPLEQLPSPAQRLVEHVCSYRSIDRVVRWLTTMAEPIRATLQDLGRGSVPNWNAIQTLRRLPGGEQLASTCLRAGLIEPPLADYRRVDELLKAMKDEGPAAAVVIVKQFWRFHLAERVALRRMRKRVDRTLEADRATLRIAFHFLRFVYDMRKRSVETMTGTDVDAWIRQAPRSHVPRLRPFLRWLANAGIVQHRFTLPSGSITPANGASESRFQALLQRARGDATLPLHVRVALLLMTTCARYPHEIVELRASNVYSRANTTWIQFTHGMRQPLDGPDAQLLRSLVTQQRKAHSPWLFASKPRPEAHLTSNGLCRLIDAAGVAINLNHLRNAACRDLLRDFTPMELCEILGMGAGVAGHWQRRGYTLTRTQRDYVNRVTQDGGGARTGHG